ncbi:MAG: carboxypeptidase-like regulatory domain-containing protein, partial [Deltaproteobacteria bacterium]|nr:carboxypeptidase-like regulatory domain-containing protein [Deltaproteobacteria bacterium]
MKAQISRDSFNEEKQYSAVYQQQGRMLTDADWNEMVRILKQRMDKTVGAAIESGSPREGGILIENLHQQDWIVPELIKDKTTHFYDKMRWGRIYVDGMYGEILPNDLTKLGETPTVREFFAQQQFFPHAPSMEKEKIYIVYVDLWERLVIALEDKGLKDSALHGADTCVRTETMAQVKLSVLELEEDQDIDVECEKWKREQPRCGTATLTRTLNNSNTSKSENVSAAEFKQKNMLFRIEVHASYLEEGNRVVEIKWSSENGAEQHKIKSEIPGFLDDKHVYECFSDVTEKLLGIHRIENTDNLHLQKGELYTKQEYEAAQDVTNMDYVRRWDGTIKLIYKDNKWNDAQNSEHNRGQWTGAINENSTQLILTNDNYTDQLVLNLDQSAGSEQQPDDFVAGDYWLALFRDNGSGTKAEVLSQKPVGIHHHYCVLGLGTLGQIVTLPNTRPMLKPLLCLTPQQWRRLSFPSLTRLTLDRVLVVDQNGDEVPLEDMLARRSSISKQGVVTFEGTLPPLAIVESDWIDPGLDTEPYIVIVGTEESDGSILIGSSFSDARVPRARVQIDPSTHHFRVRASNGETQSINLRVRWWALKTTDEAAVETHVAVALTVEPASITLVPKARKQFKAIVGGLPSTDVQWFVDDVANGDANRGLIDPQGNYTAPVVGSSTVFKIRARSTSSPSMEGTATVSVHVVTPQPGRLWGKVFDGTGLFPSPSSLPPDTSGLDGLYGAEIHLGSRYKTTNMDGDYSFDGQPAGTYELRVSKSNFK